ncbi:MAG: hypothetical protein ACLPZM_03005 [Thermoplasmata archaeon]
MVDLPRPPGSPPRPQPPTGPIGRAPSRFPEPPALQSTPSGVARSCVNCASPVSFRTSPPLCWGCGRTLCADCYWRHGLTPSAHQCASCQSRGRAASATSISGAHAGPTAAKRTP